MVNFHKKWKQFLKEEREDLQTQDQPGDGFTDVVLDENDYDVLKWILKDLQTGVGRGNMANRFVSVMDKLGIALEADAQTPSMHSEIPDVDADEIEGALAGFQDEAGSQAWKNQSRKVRGV
tara:strand:+ start:217 stop:579 length:363 start_codon:yes stop_codon:yes gene_type:complete